MKLFLASSLDKTMPLLFERMEKPSRGIEVLFVENAAEPYDDKWWVALDREAFSKYGCQITDIDLKSISKDELIQHIEHADILHICGGNLFYLLSLIEQRGIDQAIVQSVRDNKILYTGTSAGSIIAAQSVDLYVHDEEGLKYAEDRTDFSGLGLVNFLIIPHIGNPKFSEHTKNMVGHLSKNSQPVLMLNDSQAVWVEDDKFEIVSSNSQS